PFSETGSSIESAKPPVKSIPSTEFLSLYAIPVPTTAIAREARIASFPNFRKLKREGLIQVAIFKLLCRGFFTHPAKKNLVIKRAVNIEDTIPMIIVTAKPLIGPESKFNKITAAIIVVIFESTIAEKAFLYPAWIAEAILPVRANSSLILSKTRTL